MGFCFGLCHGLCTVSVRSLYRDQMGQSGNHGPCEKQGFTNGLCHGVRTVPKTGRSYARRLYVYQKSFGSSYVAKRFGAVDMMI